MKTKLILGDCLDEMKEIPDGYIDLIVTDPPYGINYSSAGGPRVSKIRKNKIKNETKIKMDTSINPKWFLEMSRVLKVSGAIYCFCNFKSYSEMRQYLLNNNLKEKTHLIWDKGNCGIGDLRGDYGNRIELILYFVKGRHILNGARDRNILSYQRPSDAHRLHPTQKPEKLYQYIIEKSSNRNDIILDPFMGSCPAGVASLKTSRNFIGVEIDEHYFKIAKTRIEASKQ